MSFESQKVLFQIYREGSFNRHYKVVYFTELGDKNKESEINHALAGDPIYDGFIKDFRKEEAKAIIAQYLERLNNGGAFDAAKFEQDLKDYIPS